MSGYITVKPKKVLWDKDQPEYYILVWENFNEVVKVMKTER